MSIFLLALCGKQITLYIRKLMLIALFIPGTYTTAESTNK